MSLVSERQSTSRAEHAGWRVWTLAVIAGASIFEPDPSLRYGGVLAVLVLATMAGRFRLQIADGLAVAVALFAAWSYTWSLAPPATKAAVIKLGAAVAIFIAIRAVITNVPRLRAVCLGYLAGCLVAVVQMLRENSISNIITPQARYGLEGLNYNYLAYALAGALPVLTVLWVTPGRIKRKWLLAAGGVVVIGIQLSGTRSAQLAVVFFLVWLLVYRVAPKTGLVVGTAAIVVVNFLIVAGSLNLLAKFDYGSRATGSLSGRLAIWYWARRMWHDHLVWGGGLGTFHPTSVVQVAPHDAMLEFGAELGIIGMALFAAFLTVTLMAGMARMDQHLRGFLIGALLVAQAPAYLVGQWWPTATAFALLAVFSRIVVIGAGDDPPHGAAVRARASSFRR